MKCHIKMHLDIWWWIHISVVRKHISCQLKTQNYILSRFKCDMRQGCSFPHRVISTRNKRTAQLCFSPVYWHCETGNQQFIWFNATLPADKQHNVLFSARASTEWFITNEPKPWKGKHYLPTKSSNTSFHEIKCICQTEFDIWNITRTWMIPE